MLIRRGSFWIAVASALYLTAGASPVRAQVAAGEITGIVTDQAGAPVPGATVTVTAVSTHTQRVAVSTSDGVYTAASLAPGAYRIDVDLAGFAPVRREGVHLATGEKARIDFGLTVGGVREQVTVTADAPIVRAETSSLGTVVEHEQVVQLPLNGRAFITLAALAPGVALPPNSQLPRINGGRPRTNEYLFDGISVLQPEPGQVAYFPVVDAIQEFKIESNSPPAEFGRFNGGVVNLTTKAGGNALHGDGFEFLRNQALNARNYFQSANAANPDYRRNQFGGTLGGPLVKDHTFFFVDYQGQRQAIARTVTSTVPTLLQRQGIFTEAIAGKVPVIYDPATTVGSIRSPFAGNTIPIGRMDPVALTLLQRYPLPTTAGTANNYSRLANEVDNQDQWDVRIDHTFASNRDQLFGRLSYFRDGFLPVTPLPDGSGVTTGTLGPQDTSAWAFASNYQHMFSSNLLNEVRIGDTRRTVGRTAAELSTSAGAALSIPGIPSTAQFPNTLPTFLVSGYQQLGSPPNTASNFNTSVSEVADSLTWLKGRHTFKMGLDWRWERLNVVQPPSPTGSFTFNAIGSDLPGTSNTGTPLASFLLGQVQNFSIDLQNAQIQERAHFQEYFIQDDWKISDRLTINPGLRYTLNFPSTEIDGQTAVFNLQTQQLEYPGTNPVRPLKKDDFGPRLGGVYRLTDKTILSAGYALVWIEMAGITTPFTTPTFPFLQTVSQRALDTINPAFVLQTGPSVAPPAPTPNAGLGQGVFAVDNTLGSGYVQQWNISVQRELTTNTTVEAAYVGSNITHVGIPDTNLNQLSVDQLALGSALLQRVPNPYFGIIPRSSSVGDPTIPLAQLLKPYPEYTTVSLYRNNVGTTRYQGLELSLRQRLAHGLSYSVAYTRSKLIDDASSVFDASILTGPVANYPVADSFNRALERDYSTGDIPHYFVSSIVWDLPAGAGRARQLHGVPGAIANDWSVSSLVTLESGVPIAVTQATNFNAFAGFGVQRPNIVGDPTLPADQQTPAHWFNTAAFGVAPQFTIGSASRNPVRGPGYRDVDLALMRRVPVSADKAVELRVEIFNLLNDTDFGAPAAVLGAANFGTITSALDPRVVQLAVKFLF
ncbi:MAG TPA: TonB-dependent receptor [Vicinamibacterales bacterium]|nr:TonB-dependent receptor [Vicinamibacterales bacterium]